MGGRSPVVMEGAAPKRWVDLTIRCRARATSTQAATPVVNAFGAWNAGRSGGTKAGSTERRARTAVDRAGALDEGAATVGDLAAAIVAPASTRWRAARAVLDKSPPPSR